MKYLKGFLMAWGCFTRVPCPYNKWHEEYRYSMLNMFPLIGLSLAVVTGLMWFVLDLSGAGGFFVGVILTAGYFFATGFIHVEGFMDCCDAIMSRRSSREKRRILKDSHVGAFAVIALVFMVMVFAASMTVLGESFSLGKVALLAIILMTSRLIAAYEIINTKPMATSQYREMRSCEGLGYGLPGIIITAGLGLVLYLTCLVDWGQIISPGNLYNLIYGAVTVSGMKLVESGIGASARNQLGGMNGDVSGYMIVLGEVTGVGALAFMVGIGG